MRESKLIESCIRYPISVAVGVLFVLFFGILSGLKIPIQLTPDISRPIISVETLWPGSSPQEGEREIVERQEEFLNSLEGLVELNSQALPNRSEITLEFLPGTSIDAALLKVNNQLSRVSSYPEEAELPVLRTSGERENAIAWLVLVPLDSHKNLFVPHLKEFVEDEIESQLERIEGVAAANVFGGQDREVRVTFSPSALASRNLTIQQVLNTLRQNGRDISGGRIDEGKRRYLVRTIGAFKDPAAMENLIIREDLRDRVRLGDIAKIEILHEDPQAQVRVKGTPCIAINVQRRTGSNLLDIMDELKVVVQDLNENLLARRGLRLEQAYDSSLYVRSSLKGVTRNLLLGASLAIMVLLLILRAARPTLIISLAIPISAVGTFVGMFLLGRTLNVVSLAGLTFAVGMLVDNSIVVLEAIFRRVQEGESIHRAAIDGTREVWGAILASTLTTVVVFVPLLFLDAEVAQLFQDIALAISCAVVLSLLVSVLVIPTLCTNLMRAPSREAANSNWFADELQRLVSKICLNRSLRLGVIVTLTLVSLFVSWFFLPPAEYLPEGSRNLVFSILIPPPGFNLDEMVRIGQDLEGDLEELWSGESPPIKNFFFVAMGTRMFMGFRASHSDHVEELMEKVQAKLSKVPGMIAVVIRAGLFGRGLSGGRSIDLRIQGPELTKL
ncbi:efflux RND transporter permease subunit, partial [bacterium]|nr:efflux RND transporter permease subunit [bacterium]